MARQTRTTRPRPTKVTGTDASRSAIPFEPRIDDLPAVTDSADLIDEQHWNKLRVTADLSAQRFDLIEITECRIVGARLSRLDLDGVRIRDTVFEDCDLAGALMQDAALTRVVFSNCRLSGLILNSSRLRDVRITDCKADQLSLRMGSAERLWCERVLLQNVDLYQSQLVLTRLFDCDLTNGEFSNVRFDDVQLHGSRLDAVRGVEHMRGATIDADQMHDFAAALLAAHRVTVTDQRDA
ncbi:MAG: pentapeptide repeat-containing protein [Ilumatobacteraceae bacterium]